jgi:hypothetical protein
MKALITAAALLFSGVAAAENLSPATIAIRVPVNAATVSISQGPWPVTSVSATATFGNACSVPTADELVLIPGYEDGFDTLTLTLGYYSERACTAEYAPVTVTIDLGTYTRPNDGLFQKVVVNGKKAQ